MGCCIAIAMVIAAVRGAWFRIFPHRRPPETGFAPPAFRAAPGSIGSAPATAAEPVVLRPAPWPALLLGAAAVTVACYAAVVELLRASGVAHGAAPLSRHLVLLGLGVGALLGSALATGRPVGPPRGRGVVLVSAGATWTALGLLDMHLFVGLHLDHSGAGLLVHAFGMVLVAAGLGHLVKRSNVPLPGGSALQSAQWPAARRRVGRTMSGSTTRAAR
ncbi:MAG: hypothetical protein ACT4QG_01200 [Sporichthyaceae bacterium]